jgi:hypothetical protein
MEETVPEIPAAWTLQQVAAERRHVPQLRRRRHGRRLRQQRTALPDERVGLDLG